MHGPGIGGVIYSTRVYYFVVIILRQVIRFYAQAKDEIINNPSMQKIIDMVTPINLKDIPPEFEVQIYQFFIQLVKDDMDKRTVVGKKMFEPVFNARLTAIVDMATSSSSPVNLYDPSNQ